MSKDPTRAEIAMHLMAAMASNPAFTNSADVLADIAVNAADTLLAALGQSGASVPEHAVNACQKCYDQGHEDAAKVLDLEAERIKRHAEEDRTVSTRYSLVEHAKNLACLIRINKGKATT